MNSEHSADHGRAFVAQSRAYLGTENLDKIRRCVDAISDDDVWWRPNDQTNSIGNLLLHLAGNVRQWVVAGIGGEQDTRERQAEFDAQAGAGRSELFGHLERAIRDADRVMAGLGPDRLHDRLVIQGREVSVLQAIYHVVEHFGMHTGQIIYITKLRTGTDLRLYRG